MWDPNPVGTSGWSRYWNGHLALGTMYAYKVAAFNRGGMGPLSAEVRALPLAPPAGLAAVAGDQQVKLTWRASTGATRYAVFRSTRWEHHTFAPVATNVTALTFVDTGLINGRKYFYRVRALAEGGESARSPLVFAQPLPSPTPPPAVAPANLVSSLDGPKVTLTWGAVPGAASYRVFRTTTGTFDGTPIATVTTPTFTQTGLVTGVTYSYKVTARNAGGDGPASAVVVVTLPPATPPPAAAPQNLLSSLNNGTVTLTWDPVATATSYRVFRTTTSAFDTTPIATVTTPTFSQPGPAIGVTFSYRVAARNAGGDGPFSAVVSVTPPPPTPPPAAPSGVSAAPGNGQITVSWTPVTGATAYNVYRGTTAGGQAPAPVGPAIVAPPFVNTGLTNGTTFFYKVTAIGAGGEGARSAEVSATPQVPPPSADPTVISSFRLLRQSTWGPKPGDVDRIVRGGVDAFLAEQFAAAPSVYPDALFDQSVETAQEHFMSLAMSGPDQLRQRVAWALHKIWVVSAVEVNNSRAIITYYRLMMNGAFGNYRDLMKAVTLNPAMGRYLNMVNNRAQAFNNNIPANENYARELMQLFTLGLSQLNPDGTPMPGPVPTYSEDDVKALARILTGWTYGDGNAATVPTGRASENFGVPMEAIAANRNYHDVTAKTFLEERFDPGVDAATELDHALDVIFAHANVAPFVSRQLIQQLVTSNPSPAYVANVAAVFDSSRGDLGAVVRAILTHPEAALTTPTSGKLAEPVLFVLSQLRAFNATITDHPFMSTKVAEMGQNVFFPGSVFSYFSPGYRVRNTGTPPLGGPEFQGLTSVTALVRANFVGNVIGGRFGTDVTIDYTPFTSRAANAADLVDYVGLVFTGGRLSAQERSEIIAAVGASGTNAQERVRTAIYLTLVPGVSQVDR